MKVTLNKWPKNQKCMICMEGIGVIPPSTEYKRIKERCGMGLSICLKNLDAEEYPKKNRIEEGV